MALAPVPAAGLTPVLFELALRNPLLLAEMNQVQFGLHFQAFAEIRRALFSPDVDDALVRGYFSRMQREADRALLDLSMLHFTSALPRISTPLLVLGAANDGFFSPASIRASAAGMDAPCEIFPGIAHAMMLEPAWQAVAERIAAWCEEIGANRARR